MKKFIYGAGVYGKRLLEILDFVGIEITAFIQTNVCVEESRACGIPVISVDRLDTYVGSKIVFIAVSDRLLENEIENTLLNKFGNEEIQIFRCRSFLEDNLLKKIQMREKKHFCLVCNNYMEKFRPGGIHVELFDKFHVIGAGYRENMYCPYCNSTARERWQYYVWCNMLDGVEATGRLLHFGPERVIAQKMKKSKIDYFAGDIVLGRAMHVVDITQTFFENESFDYIVFNHVMEHIKDEKKAMEEMKRILKPTGKMIFSFPICTDIDTFEDDSIVTEEERLAAYGLEDHVRLYGKDFVERFERYGLRLRTYSPQEELSKEMIERNGMINDDIIIVASKE